MTKEYKFKKPNFIRLFGFSLISSLLITSCTQQQESTIITKELIVPIEFTGQTIDKSLLVYDKMTSTYALNGSLFTGYATTSFEDNSSKQMFGIFQGKKQNKFVEWFKSGNIKIESTYHLGKLNGQKTSWTEKDGYSVKAQLNYFKGKLHGVQRKWYSTGEVYQILNIEMGREQGIQQGFRQNGVLYANYEVINGRTFGLKKASLCFGLENQKIKTIE